MDCLQKLYPNATEYETSHAVRLSTGNVIAAGDLCFAIVGADTTLVEVWWVASHDGTLCACVSPCQRMPDALDARNNAMTYRKLDEPIHISANDLICSCAYWDKGDVITALMPASAQLRRP